MCEPRQDTFHQLQIKEWENDLLDDSEAQLSAVLFVRMNESYEKLNNNRFDLNDFLIYHQKSLNESQEVYPCYFNLYNQPLSRRIAAVGGKIKASLDPNINMFVVNEDLIQTMVNSFVKWRKAVLSGNAQNHREAYYKGKRHKVLVVPTKQYQLRSKRDQQLLGNKQNEKTLPQTPTQMMTKNITKNLPVHFQKELYSQEQQTLLETLISRCDFNEKDPNYKILDQKVIRQRIRYSEKEKRLLSLHILNFMLSQEDEKLQHDFQILMILFSMPHVLLINYQQICYICHKYYFFTPEYVCPVEKLGPNYLEKQERLVLIFTTREYQRRKEGMKRILCYAHEFATQTSLVAKDENYIKEQRHLTNTELLYKYRPDAPLGVTPFLTDLEYSLYDSLREKLESQFLKNSQDDSSENSQGDDDQRVFYLEKLIPKHKDCQVCFREIGGPFWEHVQRKEHLDMFHHNEDAVKGIDEEIERLRKEFENSLKLESQERTNQEERFLGSTAEQSIVEEKKEAKQEQGFVKYRGRRNGNDHHEEFKVQQIEDRLLIKGKNLKNQQNQGQDQCPFQEGLVKRGKLGQEECEEYVKNFLQNEIQRNPQMAKKQKKDDQLIVKDHKEKITINQKNQNAINNKHNKH